MTLIIGPGGAGLTFLSWTIVFLRGDAQYLTMDNHLVPVDVDPLVGAIAHGFAKDHIYQSNHIVKLRQCHAQSVVYFVPTHQQDFDTVLSMNCSKIVFDCQSHGPQILARMIACLPERGVLSLYDQLIEQHSEAMVKQVLLDTHRVFTNYYQIPHNTDSFTITYDDVFVHLDKCVEKIFQYLNLAMVSHRWPAWLEIYKQYKIRNSKIYQQYVESLEQPDPVSARKILKEIIKWNHAQCPGT